jgi:hypothetical protein
MRLERDGRARVKHKKEKSESFSKKWEIIIFSEKKIRKKYFPSQKPTNDENLGSIIERINKLIHSDTAQASGVASGMVS